MNEPAQIEMNGKTGTVKWVLRFSTLRFITVENTEILAWELKISNDERAIRLNSIYTRGRASYQGPKKLNTATGRTLLFFERNVGLRILAWNQEGDVCEETLVTPKIAWYLSPEEGGRQGAIDCMCQIAPESYSQWEQWRSNTLQFFADWNPDIVCLSLDDLRSACCKRKFSLPSFFPAEPTGVLKKGAVTKRRRRPRVAA